MAGRTIDFASDVLSRLCNNVKVTVQEAEEALNCYDRLDSDLQFYKRFYVEAVRDGGGILPPVGAPGKKTKTEEEHFVIRALEKLKEEKEELDKKVKKQKDEINDLRNRLSTVMGDKLTDNNPNITDLSESFRPITLAEKFREVYDNEWTSAFEDLYNKYLDERETIDMLAEVIKTMDELCTSAEVAQMKDVYSSAMSAIFFPKTGQNKTPPNRAKKKFPQVSRYQEERSKKQLKDFRKSMAALSIYDLLQTFDRTHLLEILKKHRLTKSVQGFNKFVEQTMRLVWLMKIQDPPMKLLWQNFGAPYDKNNFTFYTKTGDAVLYTVWPAVLLHEDGPLMSKGIVQGRPAKS